MTLQNRISAAVREYARKTQATDELGARTLEEPRVADVLGERLAQVLDGYHRMVPVPTVLAALMGQIRQTARSTLLNPQDSSTIVAVMDRLAADLANVAYGVWRQPAEEVHGGDVGVEATVAKIAEGRLNDLLATQIAEAVTNHGRLSGEVELIHRQVRDAAEAIAEETMAALHVMRALTTPEQTEEIRQASDDAIAYERFRHDARQDGAEPTLSVAALRHVLRAEEGESLMTVADGTRPTTVVRVTGFAEYGTERSVAARVCLLTEPAPLNADRDAYDAWRLSDPPAELTVAAARWYFGAALGSVTLRIQRDGIPTEAVGIEPGEGYFTITGRDVGHDHDQQLRHLIDEWGALGLISKVLDPMGDYRAAELLDVYRSRNRDPIAVLARGLVAGGIGPEQARSLAEIGIEYLEDAGLHVSGNTDQPGS